MYNCGNVTLFVGSRSASLSNKDGGDKTSLIKSTGFCSSAGLHFTVNGLLQGFCYKLEGGPVPHRHF